MKAVKILSPCGILGYGFPSESLKAGLADNPDAIVVDAGSTDAGPHKLGAKTAIVSRRAAKKDLAALILGACEKDIPLIIGSAGGSGGKEHIEWTLDIVHEIFQENALKPVKTCVIYADIPNKIIAEKIRYNKVSPLGSNVPPLTEEVLDSCTGVVAQMGAEPFVKALDEGYRLIIGGRAYDPAPFAAVGIQRGFDAALCYHMGKVLECGALCCDPGTTKDCMTGVVYEDCFEVYPCDTNRKCTPLSVAAHTFYEKDHPYLLHGPGVDMDLSGCEFVQSGENTVRVSGSRMKKDCTYTVKLEGASFDSYRTFVIAGIRDPLLIEKLSEVEDAVTESVVKQYAELPRESYTINFINYGIDGVMGSCECAKQSPYEVCVLFEVLADTQEKASAVCASLRSTFMHYGYEGRKSTAGNLAFPFAPSDVEFGKVYRFSVYHLMETDNPLEYFPIKEWEPAAGRFI